MDILFRDATMTMAIFGFFAAAWFGWARVRPPAGNATWWLAGGSVLGLLLAVAGGVLSWLHWDSGSVPAAERAMTLYLVILGVEFGVALLGVLVLLAMDRREYFAPWICLVVGVHFVPLAAVLDNVLLYPLAVWLTLWPFLAVRWANRRDLAYGFTTGVGAGPALLLVALSSMLVALLAR
ncbi:hypothetical protein [Nocardiopsis lambiniae]|uniref:Prepilin peptidase n=1 Tax=Nocardiopsis lambiniae TaxID=3075539 RepID=A0ABU2MF37_9ACTN|nr:hypothetical protein [Nocardiopsis sp. DSM 44743]MDT0331305.1 hypothetical protein [Nocardiopsis sp. DSM 44743]